MKTVIGVRFKSVGKIYHFDPDGKTITAGDNVIVETARGVEFGEVMVGPRELPDKEIVQPLKKVLRVAGPEDHKRLAENKKKEQSAAAVAAKRIESHKLDMKLVDVEYTFDNNKIIFYFTADGRIDFRELVKDLASIFKTRIELRQIGVRDEAKMLGGLGSCGRAVCCSSFLGDFQPVSIKMAKEQSLSLSPTKISGLCGRLMCCLKYEQDFYESMRKKMPKVGKEVKTPDGSGIVIENSALKGISRVKLPQPDGTLEIREYPLSKLSWARPNRAAEEEDPTEMDEEVKKLLD